MALCVMGRFTEAAPAAVGENRTVTVADWPGVKLKAPPPLTTENGSVKVPTLPVRVAFELAWFMIVIVWNEFDPTSTFPKSTEDGVIDISITEVGVVTFTIPVIPEAQWTEQK